MDINQLQRIVENAAVGIVLLNEFIDVALDTLTVNAGREEGSYPFFLVCCGVSYLGVAKGLQIESPNVRAEKSNA
jgi:hypothetical protein